MQHLRSKDGEELARDAEQLLLGVLKKVVIIRYFHFENVVLLPSTSSLPLIRRVSKAESRPAKRLKAQHKPGGFQQVPLLRRSSSHCPRNETSSFPLPVEEIFPSSTTHPWVKPNPQAKPGVAVGATPHFEPDLRYPILSQNLTMG